MVLGSVVPANLRLEPNSQTAPPIARELMSNFFTEVAFKKAGLDPMPTAAQIEAAMVATVKPNQRAVRIVPFSKALAAQVFPNDAEAQQSFAQKAGKALAAIEVGGPDPNKIVSVGDITNYIRLGKAGENAKLSDYLGANRCTLHHGAELRQIHRIADFLHDECGATVPKSEIILYLDVFESTPINITETQLKMLGVKDMAKAKRVAGLTGDDKLHRADIMEGVEQQRGIQEGLVHTIFENFIHDQVLPNMQLRNPPTRAEIRTALEGCIGKDQQGMDLLEFVSKLPSQNVAESEEIGQALKKFNRAGGSPRFTLNDIVFYLKDDDSLPSLLDFTGDFQKQRVGYSDGVKRTAALLKEKLDSNLSIPELELFVELDRMENKISLSASQLSAIAGPDATEADIKALMAASSVWFTNDAKLTMWDVKEFPSPLKPPTKHGFKVGP